MPNKKNSEAPLDYIPNINAADKSYGTACELLDKGLYSQASELFKEARTSKPNNIIIQKAAADVDLKLGRYNAALNAFQNALPHDKSVEDLLFLHERLGLTNIFLGKRNSAKFFFEQNETKDMLSIKTYLAYLNIFDGKFNVAEKIFKELTDTNEKPDGYVQEYVETGEKLLKFLKNALQNDKKMDENFTFDIDYPSSKVDIDELVLLSSIGLYSFEHYTNAHQLLDKYIDFHKTCPKDAVAAYIQKGIAYTRERKHVEAKNAFNFAQELDPEKGL